MTLPREQALSRRRLVALWTSSLVLAGCGESLIGPSQPPLQIYVLRPQFRKAMAAAPLDWQLSVALPEASQTLQTQRIALLRGTTMDYFADAEWTDTTPRLLQSLLVEALEAPGRIGGVAPESAGIHADYTLETEVRSFEAHYRGDAAPEVEVTIVAHLLAADGRVVKSLKASHSTVTASNNLPAIIDAFTSAAGECLNDIVAWTLQAPRPKRP